MFCGSINRVEDSGGDPGLRISDLLCNLGCTAARETLDALIFDSSCSPQRSSFSGDSLDNATSASFSSWPAIAYDVQARTPRDGTLRPDKTRPRPIIQTWFQLFTSYRSILTNTGPHSASHESMCTLALSFVVLCG